MNPFESYREFLQPETDSADTYSQNQSDYKTFSHDDLYTDVVHPPKFYHSPYPIDLAAYNIFCPMCGKEVKNTDSHLTYESSIYHRKFLAHGACINQDVRLSFTDEFDHVEEMKIIPGSLTKIGKPLEIGDRQFCIELLIVHPLNDYKFIKQITKKTLSQNKIRWELWTQTEENCYLPNMICFPFVDFKVVLTLSEIGSGENKTTITKYVNLTRSRSLQLKSLIAKSDQVSLEILIHSEKDEKNEVLDKMNYKYKFGHLALPIIELIAIELEIPEEQFQSYDDENSSSIVKTLLSDKEDASYRSSSYYNNSVHSSAYTSSVAYSNREKVTQNSDSKMLSDKSFQVQKDKFDFELLLSSNKLSAYVKNNVNSRIFQNFLSEKATTEQIQMIIDHLFEELQFLITDEYANYMTQKLFEVSIPTQRIKILAKLFEHIPKIVKNKHGTHTMQFFTKFMTLDEQYSLVCKSIQNQYHILSFHSISTHFIRKIISVFPFKHTLTFFNKTNQKFLDYATDKHAMCVIKHMIYKLKQLENDPLTFEIKQHFVNSITLNTDKIIQDNYGNYVVQFCYQLIGQAKSSGVTEMIIEKFVQFSIQKYSHSVISKCINVYWTDKSYTNRLKDSLKNQGILQMYKNKEGNKILLDLMDNNETTPLRQKINNVIASVGEPTKFYHDRWGMQIGIRSGPVGFPVRSFGQAEMLVKNNYKQGGKDTASKKSRKK